MNKHILISFFIFAVTSFHQAESRFDQIADVNKDGRIDRNEFNWAYPDANLYEAFGRFDANNDGFIDQSDVQNVRRARQGRGKIFKKLVKKVFGAKKLFGGKKILGGLFGDKKLGGLFGGKKILGGLLG